MGSELAARGVATPLPMWSAGALDAAPEAVLAIHRDYATAGATVHTTNTFRTRRSDVGERWRELTGRAAELARRGAGSGQRVAGSIAPLEDCYRPDLSPGEGAFDAHAQMASALAEAGCDLLLCETFPAVAEAEAAVRAGVAIGRETWGSLSAGPEADLLTPLQLARGAERLARAGAAAVLVNCVPAVRTLAFVRELAGVGVPFGAYANAGSADDAIGWRSDPSLGAARYAELAESWVDVGATLVGGCCGTGPAHVRALVTRLRG